MLAAWNKNCIMINGLHYDKREKLHYDKREKLHYDKGEKLHYDKRENCIMINGKKLHYDKRSFKVAGGLEQKIAL